MSVLRIVGATLFCVLLGSSGQTIAQNRPLPPKDPKAAGRKTEPAEPQPIIKPVTLPGGVKLRRVDFERHVMGVVGRLGCNGGSCHGSFQGRGGFRLSLFAYDFDRDFGELTDRVDIDDPDASYLLDKPTMREEHGGGLRMEPDSWQYKLVTRWIAEGARREPGSGKINKIETVPREYRFSRPGQTAQVKVMATFEDGARENITPFCHLRVNDEYVAEINESGKLTGLHAGDTAVVITYRDQVLTSRALVTAEMETNDVYPDIPQSSYIDRHVFSKLEKLNIVPSEMCQDGDFLRRVYIDTIGRLPSPEEARKFIADKNPKKRANVISQLLRHPLHASLWATKMCDVTGNNTEALEQPREKRSRMWYDWLRHRFQENQPYDKIVEGILCATSREKDNVDQWIRKTTSLDETLLTSFETSYHERDTLDLFWARRNLSLEQMGEQVAAAFLGVRLQCAQCHKHPYDRWTQADYRAFANVFGQVKVGASPDAKKQVDEENNRRKKIKDKKKRLGSIREVFVDIKNPRRLNDPNGKGRLPARTLGGPEVDMETDGRKTLIAWMREADNPLFARSFANRVWQHYFGVGIVEPIDDFSAANPPSNEPLLDELAREFVESGYDIRKLERAILSSRTYQLSSQPKQSNQHDRRNFARSYPRRMMAEVVVDVVNSALAASDKFNRDAPEGSSAIEVAASTVQDGNLRYAFRIFGRPPRTAVCDCQRSDEPSLPQTLYLMTDSNVMRKIRDGRVKNVLAKDDRLNKVRSGNLAQSDLKEIVDELFLCTLTRYPNDNEQQSAFEHIQESTDRPAALVDIVWALINTREFILNH